VIWEVFRQEREGQPFQHGGSLEAPNLVVADVFDRDYRRVDGYSLKVKLKEARERAGTSPAG
jgi:1,2-phenylacetyl-CoA epoxidase PaaB subunit